MPIDPEDPRLTAYALGELEDDEKADLEHLLSESDEGRRVVDEVRDTARLLSETLAEEVAPGLNATHWKTIERELPVPATIPFGPRPSWEWRKWAGYGIAASLLLGFGASAGWLAHDRIAKPLLDSPIAMGPARKASPDALGATTTSPQPAAEAKKENRALHLELDGAVPQPPSGPEDGAVQNGRGRTKTGYDQLALTPSLSDSNHVSVSPPPASMAKRLGERGADESKPAPAGGKAEEKHLVPLRSHPVEVAVAPAQAADAVKPAVRSSSPSGLSYGAADVTPKVMEFGNRPASPGDPSSAKPGDPKGAKPGAALAGVAGAMLGEKRDRYYYEQEVTQDTAKRNASTSSRSRYGIARSPQLQAGSAPLAAGRASPGAPMSGGQMSGMGTLMGRGGMGMGGGGMGGAPQSRGLSTSRSATLGIPDTLAKAKKQSINEYARGESLAQAPSSKERLFAAKVVADAENQLALAPLTEGFKAGQTRLNAQVEAKDQLQELSREKRDRAPILDPIAGDFAEQVVAPVVAAPPGEDYNKIEDNKFKPAAVEPLSTFSIDVDTASYANIRRFLVQDNRLPPPDAVRIEELVNYFPYDYPAPANDKPDAPPFSVNVEIARCPWNADNRLAKIGLKGKVDAKKAVANLVFLVDVSGSMDEPNRLPLVQASLRMLVEQLGENDRVSIVVYAGAAGLVLDSTSGLHKHEIASSIDQLRAGGSTAGGAGINLAYDIARKHFVNGGVNRVILCTDGDFNVGVSDDKALQTLITEKAKSGVFLTVLGYGTGNLKDAKMEQLADKGNGNCHYIDGLAEARKVLVEQMGGTLVTVGKDVKIQVDFNPAKVGTYRLIGYENRALEAKDFADDKKDAGEIGAGHTVTALYELTPPDKEVFSKDNASNYVNNELRDPKNAQSFTVKLRYKEPDGSKSKLFEHAVTDGGKDFAGATEDFKFASSVAAFGMILRDSPHRGNATFNALLEWAESGKGKDASGYRKEFCDIVRKARDLTTPAR